MRRLAARVVRRCSKQFGPAARWTALTVLFAAALVRPAFGQVTLAWKVPGATPGATAFEQGRYEVATRELQSALAGTGVSATERLSWRLELSRAIFGSGDQKSATQLAMEVVDEAADAKLPAVALKALLVAADAGYGYSFDQRLRLVDAAASIVKQPLPSNADLRLQVELVRALIQTRVAPPQAIETMARARDIATSGAPVSAGQTAWIELVESRALSLNGSSREALPLAIAANQHMDGAFGHDHPARIYSTLQLALVHRRVGNYSNTRGLAAAGLEAAAMQLPEAHPWTLELLSVQYQEELRADDLRAARATFSDLLSGTERRHGKGTLFYLDAEAQYAELLMQEGAYPDALRHIQRVANDIGKLAAGGPAHLNALHQLAIALVRNDRAGDAQVIWQELLALEIKTKGPGSEDVWASINNLASVYRTQGDLDRALAQYVFLESLIRPRVQRTQSALVSVVNNASEVLIATNRPTDAHKRLKPLIADLTADRKPSDAQLLRARSNNASALAAMGNKDAALAEHLEVLKIRRDALGADHPDTLRSFAQTAYALESVGRYEEAAKAYIDVYRLRQARLGPLSSETIFSARAAAGFLANLMNRPGEASDLYGQAINGVENLRRGIGQPLTVRQRYFSDFAQMYKDQARTLAKLGRWHDVFNVVELSKARTLIEQTRATSLTAATQLTTDERVQLAEAERLVSAHTSKLVLSTESTSPGQIKLVEQERDRALVRLATLRGGLAKKYGWAGRQEDASPAPITRAVTDLEADDTFVSFSLLGDALLVVRLKPDGTVRGNALSPVQGLASSIAAVGQIASVRGGLDQVQLGNARQPPRYLWRLSAGGFSLLPVDQPAPEGAELASSLDELVDFVSGALLRAIPEDVWKSRRLLLSLDEQLSTLPLDLLVRQGKRWGQTHELTIAQSWTMHVLLKERERNYAGLRREPILVFGNPAYAGGRASDSSSRAFERRENEGPVLPFGKLTWFELAGAGREVASLSAIYPLSARATLFERESASEANLAALSAKGTLAEFKVIHFATHGYLHPRNPLLSSVVLAEAGVGEGKSAGVDGYVTAADWLGLHMKSDLTVVAACDTGAGQPVSGEGMVGLPFGLFAAGNRSTLLTLWSVYDEATAEFTRRFHAHVRNGKRYSTALALTKREFMDGEAGDNWRAPAFWAPFVLYGT